MKKIFSSFVTFFVLIACSAADFYDCDFLSFENLKIKPTNSLIFESPNESQVFICENVDEFVDLCFIKKYYSISENDFVRYDDEFFADFNLYIFNVPLSGSALFGVALLAKEITCYIFQTEVVADKHNYFCFSYSISKKEYDKKVDFKYETVTYEQYQRLYRANNILIKEDEI